MIYKIEKEDNITKARAGKIITKKNIEIETPIFMPVGTLGSVKAIHQRELIEDIKTKLILGNTYHLYFRPGLEILKKAGGLHKFMNWNNLILTDSGGYQVYSLADNRKITEDGVEFKNHKDGSKHFFSPEKAIDIQRIIGADIIMAFDECTSPDCSYQYAKDSMSLTHRWLNRCINRFGNSKTKENDYQSLFPIVQGGIYKDLRKISAETISEADMPGNAIGGVCHPTGHLYEITEFVCDILPKDKPRYLMGVGTPKDLLECISLGVDMFDCIMPTRNGRNGTLFTTKGIINIRNRRWKTDFSPIDQDLGGYVSTHYSKSYLNHLFQVHEILGFQIASIHNLRFYLWLVKQARNHIIQNDFNIWKNDVLKIISDKV
ncbi:MAG: tRNA guanosine(34) transglycosylase Tgt [Bacteroidetes bacterium]|nr:tRNA guanosine(34) transglycosylase Tgt [Bacteroidota bacterium]